MPTIGSLTVTCQSINVRPQPDTANAPIGSLAQAATVPVVAEVDGWYEIAYNGLPGGAFVSANPKFAKFTRTKPLAEDLPKIRLTATVNVRTRPDVHAEDIGDAEADSEFEVIAKVGNWYKVRWNDGYAFITATRAFHVEVAAEQAALNAALEAAKAAPVAVVAPNGVAWQPTTVKELAAPAANANLPLTVAMIEPVRHPFVGYANAQLLIAALNGGQIRTPEQFAAADGMIVTLPSADQADFYELLTLYTPYFSQRDNDARTAGSLLESKGGRMCNLTSLAMILSRQGVRPPGDKAQPEDRLEAIRLEKNYGPRTTFGGWGKVAESQNLKTRWLKNAPDVCTLAWWRGEPLNHIRRGYSLMASITGHIVAVVGIDAGGIYVHDPYGANVLTKGAGHEWKGFNVYDNKDGITQSTVGRWLRHDGKELRDHSWNWVIAMRGTTLGGA